MDKIFKLYYQEDVGAIFIFSLRPTYNIDKMHSCKIVFFFYDFK